jgi:translation initiation factor IF-2
MTDKIEKDGQKKVLSLSTKSRLEIGKKIDMQNLLERKAPSKGKAVTVEVKRRKPSVQEAPPTVQNQPVSQRRTESRPNTQQEHTSQLQSKLTVGERANRARVLEAARLADIERQKQLQEEKKRLEAEEKKQNEEQKLKKETFDLQKSEEIKSSLKEVQKSISEGKPKEDISLIIDPSTAPGSLKEDKHHQGKHRLENANVETEEEFGKRSKVKKVVREEPLLRTDIDAWRKGARLIAADDEDVEESKPKAPVRTLGASRKKDKYKKHHQEVQKVIRDVLVPDHITVQELASRMAERSGNVIKSLMKMGIMATINQTIDADIAELLVIEAGHKVKRVSDNDMERDLQSYEDNPEDVKLRAPVVTVMGHVDHGKTSLLDALRSTDVVASEHGGITQHIGAYRVTLPSGEYITFIDTPGHAAFSEMRARGANATDIVVLVVAADDGVKEQTIEAIRHAQAANVPIVVAINKIDKPGANPDRVATELLSHNLVLESLGGDILSVEVSAKNRTNLEKLEEILLLQSEILQLKANAKRPARGVVIEAKLDKGRGPVATILVQNGTLKVGDCFFTGSEWGRVRALVDDHGRKIDSAGPSTPVEILGLNGTPYAGDDFVVVENESKAREVAATRAHRKREADARPIETVPTSLEDMMSRIAEGNVKTLDVIVKSDVHGSMEAITSSLQKLSNNEVRIRILHSGVGAISESDIVLGKASRALIIGFNVRANTAARDLAKKEGIDIRYYSIIYDIIDDAKAMLSGMLAPTLKERFLGYAEIRQVFNITKVGKVAGAFVTEGVVKRGAKVRLLRDNIVIHEGTLKTLKRFKDEVKEVKENYECGLAFENYHDIQEKDRVECFELESIVRTWAEA